jgi:hypothetical protein
MKVRFYHFAISKFLNFPLYSSSSSITYDPFDDRFEGEAGDSKGLAGADSAESAATTPSTSLNYILN